jgi:hypothetical protein
MTRVLSLVAWHHFAYLIISLALLGIGAAGTYLTATLSAQTRESLGRWVARFAFLFAVSIFVCLLFVLRLRFDPIHIYVRGDLSELYSLALIELAVALPYFFAGTAVGAILSTAGEEVGGVYFADLAGAAAGGLLSLLLIDGLSAQSSIFASATLAAVAACVLMRGTGSPLPASYLAAAVAGVLLTVMGAIGDPIPVRFPGSKMAGGNEHRIETTRWNSIARIDVFAPQFGLHTFGGGFAEQAKPHPYKLRYVTQDGAAPTGIVMLDAPPAEMKAFRYYLQALPFEGRESPNVLVIGVGGGPDVVIALHHGARQVVGVEVNSAMVDLLEDEYAEFSGGLAFRPDVEIINAEGRHFLTRDPRRFDIIQMSGVDTFTAVTSGAYALAENFLYTAEATHDLLDHLNPDGVLSVARWLFTPPRETLRLVTTQLRALEDRGQHEVWDRFVIVHGRPLGRRHEAFPWADTLLKNGSFTREEVDRYRAWAKERGFTMVYDPFEQRDNEFDRLIRATPEERRALVDGYLYDVSPSTDDRPFFFQFYRLSNVFGGTFLDPLLVAGSEQREQKTGRLGEVPLGLIVLLASILLIAVLSAVLIAAPLARSRGALAGARGIPAVIAYFALVGLGFMFVEIVLLQKLTVFLGGPTYSMGVTLSSLLFFTGVGAGLSRFLDAGRRVLLLGALGVLLAVMVVELWFLRAGVPALLGLSHLVRCLVAVVAIAPVGILLGFPFPIGLRMVGMADSRLVPWAYGINGCASVLGGMVCVLVSMQTGLSAAWLVGWVFYVVAGVAVLGLPVPARASLDVTAPVGAVTGELGSD